EHFVPALARLASAHELFLYADTKRPFELRDLPPNVVLRCLPWRGRLSSLYLDLFLRREMARDRLDVVHYPANYGFGPPGRAARPPAPRPNPRPPPRGVGARPPEDPPPARDDVLPALLPPPGRPARRPAADRLDARGWRDRPADRLRPRSDRARAARSD